MQLLGGYTHLRAHTEFKAVGKAGTRVDIYGGAVDQFEELIRSLLIFGHDAVAVVRAVFIDVRDRFVYAVYNFDRNF